MKTLALILSLIAAGPALSLSCVPPNAAQQFNWAVDAPDTYGVFVGQIRALEKIRDPNATRTGPVGIPWSLKTEFTGKMLSRSGPGEMQTLPVTAKVTCLASWCGGVANDTSDRLYYIKKTDAGFELTFGPCDRYGPDPAITKTIKTLQKCMRRGRCSNAQIRSLDMRP